MIVTPTPCLQKRAPAISCTAPPTAAHMIVHSYHVAAFGAMLQQAEHKTSAACTSVVLKCLQQHRTTYPGN